MTINTSVDALPRPVQEKRLSEGSLLSPPRGSVFMKDLVAKADRLCIERMSRIEKVECRALVVRNQTAEVIEDSPATQILRKAVFF